MLDPVNREDDSVYPPHVSHPTTVSLLATALHAAVASVVSQRALALGTVRIVLGIPGFEQARAALVDGLRLVSRCR